MADDTAPRQRRSTAKDSVQIQVRLHAATLAELDHEADRRLLGRNLLIERIIEAALVRLSTQDVEVNL